MSDQDLAIDPSEVGALASADQKAKKSSRDICSNCDSPLQGAFCHQCGQPTRHFIRFFPVVVREIAEDTLGVDGRFWRTFIALLFRPGRLTNDYLNGKRIYYSPPIRLYLLTSVLAFLVITSVVDSALDSNKDAIQLAQDMQDKDDISVVFNAGDATRDSVEKSLETRRKVFEDLRKLDVIDEQELAKELGIEVDSTRVETGAEEQTPTDEVVVIGPEAGQEIAPAKPADANEVKPQEPTDESLADSQPDKENDAESADISVSEDEPEEDEEFSFTLFGSEPWDAETNPLELPFLTAAMNARLNDEISEFKERLPEIKKNPRILVDRILELLPQTMFLLLPAFALILKVFYMFSRRYYMEHLIFALHNHAFVFAVISLAAIANWLGEWIAGGAVWAEYFNGGLQLWLFIYLFLAQKRVYGQGWIFTAIKYFFVGISYSVLLTVVGLLASLVGIILV